LLPIPSPRFRLATTDDQPFAYELIKIGLPDILGTPAPDWPWDDFLKSWHRGTKVVIMVDNEQVGYLRYERDPGALHLADLQVVPAFRRRGVAAQAITYFECKAREENLGKVTLIVHDTNPAAASLYAKMGYRCEKRDCSRSLLVKIVR
jgi:ribosomal protein S18 acetylase RimI-like enzyme